MLVIYIYATKASCLSQSSVNIDYRTQTLAIHKNVRSTKLPPLETWPNNIKTWMKWKTLWSKKIVYIHASNTRLQNLAIVTVFHGVITLATLYDCKHMYNNYSSWIWTTFIQQAMIIPCLKMWIVLKVTLLSHINISRVLQYKFGPIISGIRVYYKAFIFKHHLPWWRYQMETFSASLAICEGNPPVTDGFPS